MCVNRHLIVYVTLLLQTSQYYYTDVVGGHLKIENFGRRCR